jgi:hypothetical protein
VLSQTLNVYIGYAGNGDSLIQDSNTVSFKSEIINILIAPEDSKSFKQTFFSPQMMKGHLEIGP